MKTVKSIILSITLLGALFAAGQAFSAPAAFRKDFIDALEANDGEKMHSTVDANKDNVPGEIKALLTEAKEAKEEDRAGVFHIAEMMARYYKDITGNAEQLIEVRRADFESRLSPAVASKAANGVHTVEFPKPAADVKNVFRPDNIVIKKGETVRWVNNDETAHVFASMQFIGKKGIKSPSVEPGKSYEFKFEEAGEYYYICFIHHGMVGKVTVEE